MHLFISYYFVLQLILNLFMLFQFVYYFNYIYVGVIYYNFTYENTLPLNIYLRLLYIVIKGKVSPMRYSSRRGIIRR